jgi:hypothetical protein
MKTTNIDWRYIAGFFDGEGSVTVNASGYRISIPQTNRLVLESIRRVAGAGYVVHVTKRQTHWRESWTYFISRQQSVYDFLCRVEPYLIVKRKIVNSVLHQLPLILRRQNKRREVAIIRRRNIHRLRGLGLSYRDIGKKLGLDFGYVRRVFLRGVK